MDLKIELIRNYFAQGNFKEVDNKCDSLLMLNLKPEQLLEVHNIKASSLIGWIDTSYDRDSDQIRSKSIELEQVVKQERAIVKQHFPNDSERKMFVRFHEATMHFLNNNKTEMLSVADEIESILMKETDNIQLAETYLGMLSPYYLKGGRYDKVLKLIPKVDYDQPLIGKVYDMQVLSEANLQLGRIKEAQGYYTTMAELIMESVKNEFPLMTEKEKENYWQMYERQIADVGRFADAGNEESDFGGVVYDLALNSKGILLNSGISFSEFLKTCKDEELELLYESYRKAKIECENVSKSQDESKYSKDRLRGLEETLLRKMSEKGLKVNLNKYSWKEIQGGLNTDDVAIEFIELQDIDYSREYAAIVTSQALKNPVFVKLGKTSEIDSEISDSFTSSSIWNKLTPYLNESGKIYFSPVGNLNCFAIESLLDENGYSISSKYNLYRVSSTKQIIEGSYLSGNGLALFGGIDYGNTSTQGGVAYRGSVHSLPTLPGTQKELYEICQIVNSIGINADTIHCFSGKEGSEINFRNLSGKALKVIHVGTHGYYIPSRKKSQSRIPFAIQHFYNKDSEENPMINNGLFFAGANLSSKYDSSNDGIVTALEISNLDFSNVDLVVLSACNTGLGKLTGDGVFGLQRGLKIAGVNSILMTLNRVNDDITCDFMVKFYSDFLSGLSKHESYENAKELIRKKYPSSTCWRDFILLDALE